MAEVVEINIISRVVLDNDILMIYYFHLFMSRLKYRAIGLLRQ